MTEDRLLTLDEVADQLRVTVRTVQRFVESGQLRVVRLSRKVTRFRASDVEAFITAHQVGGEDAGNEPGDESHSEDTE